MFSTLLESKARKQRSPGATAFSAVMHTVLISLAVYATAHAKSEMAKPKEVDIQMAEIKKEPPPPPKNEPPPPQDQPLAPPPPKGFQVLQAPVDIPDVIPKIDLTKAVTNAEDFTGVGVAGGVGRGQKGGTGPVTDDAAPMYNFAVDKPAYAIPGQDAPPYPGALRNAHVEGEVQVQFVVDTTGHADMSTFKVLSSPHEMFTQAVRNQLPKYRYIPAEVNGRKVKVFVSQAFIFKIGS
jgi:periplasmic protein TonB